MLCFGLCLAIMAAPYPEVSRRYFEEWIAESEVNRAVRKAALEAGLSEVDANDLVSDLMCKFPSHPPSHKYLQYWEREEFDLWTFLKQIKDWEGLPFCGKHEVSQLSILLWICRCEDHELREWLIQFVQNQMKQPITNYEDAERVHNLLAVLGHEKSDDALNVLFRLQSKEAWDQNPPIQIQMADMSTESKEVEIYYVRAAALTGIAFSGTDRALHAFATGNGLADDLSGFESNFHVAAHARFGIYELRRRYEIGLEPELEAKLKALYEKYGMKYEGRDLFVREK